MRSSSREATCSASPSPETSLRVVSNQAFCRIADYGRVPALTLVRLPHQENPQDECDEREAERQEHRHDPAEHGDEGEDAGEYRQRERDDEHRNEDDDGLRGVEADEAVLLLEHEERDAGDGSEEVGE